MSTCQARLYIGDDFGDNHATIRCQLEEGHQGQHQEKFMGREVTVTWRKDEGLAGDPAITMPDSEEEEDAPPK